LGTSNNDDFVVGSITPAARRSFPLLIWRGCVSAFCGRCPVQGPSGTSPLCRGHHPLQRHKPADVVGEVLQADLGFRPHDTDRPYNPTTRRCLLSTEHVLDASSNLALLVVGVLLCFR